MLKRVISIDLGGTNIRAAIINSNLRIEKVIKSSTEKLNFDILFHQVIDLIDELMASKYPIDAICFGVAGRVRLDGYINELPNLHMSDIPLSNLISNKYHLPVYVINDAHAAGLAEATAGAGKHYHRSYFVTISTGFGGAMFVDKKFAVTSDEVGHTLFEYKGKYYELEHLVSGTGIKNLCAINGLTVTSSKEMFEGVKESKVDFIKVYEDWLNLLSSAFQYIAKTFEVEVFTITGGVMKSQDIFFSNFKSRNKNLKIVTCHFKEDAGLIGGAVYAFDHVK